MGGLPNSPPVSQRMESPNSHRVRVRFLHRVPGWGDPCVRPPLFAASSIPSPLACLSDLWYTQNKQARIRLGQTYSTSQPRPLNHRPTTNPTLSTTLNYPERTTPMTFEPISDHLLHKLERSLDSSNPTSAFPGAPAQPARSPAPFQTGVFLLSEIPSQPLSWLWPGRIPLGHLTLLDAAPGCGLSLLALTLAACISSGSPLPDGTPTQQGTVIILAPYDSAADTIKPRLSAAGGDPAHVLLFCPLVEDASRTLARTRPFSFPQDLDHLATMIRCLEARLVILDPASAIPGLSRCLPALIELAHQPNCSLDGGQPQSPAPHARPR